MVLCFVAECSHKNDVDSCQFFRFPTDSKQFRLWKDLSRRADGAEPNSNSRLCSCHVERAIQRLKIYKVLDFIPASYRSKASKMFQVCACLSNLQPPIIRAVDL